MVAFKKREIDREEAFASSSEVNAFGFANYGGLTVSPLQLTDQLYRSILNRFFYPIPHHRPPNVYAKRVQNRRLCPSLMNWFTRLLLLYTYSTYLCSPANPTISFYLTSVYPCTYLTISH